VLETVLPESTPTPISASKIAVSVLSALLGLPKRRAVRQPAARIRSEPDGCRIVETMASPDPATFVFAVILAAAISMGVFAHASKHGSRHPTAWGVAAFLAAGVAVPLYFIRYWMRRGAST
jgi:hypothetical protein